MSRRVTAGAARRPGGLAVMVVTAAVVAAGCTHPAPSGAAKTATSPSAPSPATATTGPVATGYLATPPAGSTLVAATRGRIPRFTRPSGPQHGWVPGTWFGAPSILPVLAEIPGWFEVRLAQRPNESTAWVLARDVRLSQTPYRILIDLTTKHLTLYRSNRNVFSAPAGIGLPAYPTPTGSYFVAFFAKPPSPGYGAFVVVTSAHSNTITDWDFSGDAVVAIHGPLGTDAEIGTTGTRISHGCIRLHESDLLRLRPVPAGSPVDIIAG